VPELVSSVEGGVDGDTEVVGDKGVVFEDGSECVESFEESNDSDEDQRNPGEVRLEGSFPGEGVARDALSFEGFHETNVRPKD